MRRVQHALAVVLVVAALVELQLRAGVYSRPSLIGLDPPTTTHAAARSTARASFSPYAFLVHAVLFASAVALTVLHCYRRAVERRVDPNEGPLGLRWNGSKWVNDDGAMGRSPGPQTGVGMGVGSGPPGVRYPASAYPPGPDSYGAGDGSAGGGGHGFDPGPAHSSSSAFGSDDRSQRHGYTGYQGAESPQEAQRRFERERQQTEYWARVEREEEERVEREEEERERRAAAKSAKKQAAHGAEGRGKKEAKGEKSRKKWERFDTRWAELEASGTGGDGRPLTYDDVPWPPKMSALLHHAAGGGKDASTVGARELKLAYHKCIRRWHPDKFAARFKRRLDAGGEGDRVMERVNAVARALTTEFGKHS